MQSSIASDFCIIPADAYPSAMHFDPHGTPGIVTAPTANAMQTFGTPAHTVNVAHTPSFPAYQTPSLVFGSADADLHAACTTAPVNPMYPTAHTLNCVSMYSYAHTGSAVMSTLPTFHGKLVNPAPVSGLVPPQGGPLHGPPSGTGGYPSSLAYPSDLSGPLPTLVHLFCLLLFPHSSFWSPYSF